MILKSIKKKVLKKFVNAISFYMAVQFVVSGCMVDSESWIPTLLVGISILWSAVIVLANEMNGG